MLARSSRCHSARGINGVNAGAKLLLSRSERDGVNAERGEAREGVVSVGK